MNECPHCHKLHTEQGTYCSEECLNADLPFIMKEWSKIPGLSDIYRINRNGDLISLNHANQGKKKALIPQLNYKGYYHIRLINDQGKRGSYLVHRLVAKTFIPNHLNKHQVNHKNGDKIDNSVDNLEWVTNYENYQHSVDNHLQTQKHHNGIIDYTQPRIKYFILDANTGVYYYGARDFSQVTGLSQKGTLDRIKNENLPKQYILT